MDRGPEYDAPEIVGSKPEVCMDCAHFEEWPALGRDWGRCPKQAKPESLGDFLLNAMKLQAPTEEES